MLQLHIVRKTAFFAFFSASPQLWRGRITVVARVRHNCGEVASQLWRGCITIVARLHHNCGEARKCAVSRKKLVMTSTGKIRMCD